MSIEKIIRAWKDEDYRSTLSDAERALLPQHPAGLIELSGAEMEIIEGGSCCCTCSCPCPCTCLCVMNKI